MTGRELNLDSRPVPYVGTSWTGKAGSSSKEQVGKGASRKLRDSLIKNKLGRVASGKWREIKL